MMWSSPPEAGIIVGSSRSLTPFQSIRDAWKAYRSDKRFKCNTIREKDVRSTFLPFATISLYLLLQSSHPISILFPIHSPRLAYFCSPRGLTQLPLPLPPPSPLALYICKEWLPQGIFRKIMVQGRWQQR